MPKSKSSTYNQVTYFFLKTTRSLFSAIQGLCNQHPFSFSALVGVFSMSGGASGADQVVQLLCHTSENGPYGSRTTFENMEPSVIEYYRWKVLGALGKVGLKPVKTEDSYD